MRRTRSYPCTLLFQSQFNFSLLHFEAVLGGKSVEGGEWNRRILLKSLLEVCGVLCENEAVCVGHFWEISDNSDIKEKVKKRKLKETAFQGEQVKCDWYWPLQDLLCPLTLASGNWGRFSIGLGSFWEQDCEIRKKERRNKNKNRNKIELKRISLEIQLSFHKSHTCYRFCLHWRWGALLWKYKSPCNILWPGAVEKK